MATGNGNDSEVTLKFALAASSLSLRAFVCSTLCYSLLVCGVPKTFQVVLPKI